jgi:hypothetical protein
MSALPKTILTATEYLAIERAAETKSEFFDGEMFAMAGTTKNLRITTDPTTFVNLTSIGCEIPLAEIYERVEFSVRAPTDGEPCGSVEA